MSGTEQQTGVKQRRVKTDHSQERQAANLVEQNVLATNERILNEIFDIYTEKEFGISKIASCLNTDVRMPRRKISILILGNHSAGKSSFINWYIEESILKTGVAIETQGFYFVTSGKKRETLKGQATLQLYPHLKPIQEMPGVVDFLATEISTSRAKKFNLVTFVDTPGLVDGDMHYPYDVNDTLTWLGEMADMVLVFFDPMGQALCRRTLNIVEKLWASHSDKMRLYLAKADEAGSETDRQKVLMQIVQELCKRPGLNRTGFDMPTIYLPNAEFTKPSKCANQIEDVCLDIEKMINQTVQNSLNNLEKDCELFRRKLQNRLMVDTETRSRNFTRWTRSWCLGSFGIIIPILFFVSLIVYQSSEPSLRHHIGFLTSFVQLISAPLVKVWMFVPPERHLEMVVCVIALSGICLILSRFSPYEPVLPKREVKYFKKAAEKIDEYSEKKAIMYSEYLKQSVGEAEYAH